MPGRFLIIDGYSQTARDDLAAAGMELAHALYAHMLTRWLPDAQWDVWLPSAEQGPPDQKGPRDYRAILWTGSNLNVYDRENPFVARQVAFARMAYEAGTPAFGSCWGLQVAVTAADGEVAPNPRGREIGIARGIRPTARGREHPMFAGKPAVFDNFASHLDHVTKLPAGAVVLAGNEFSPVQAIEITHQRGTFWGVQYHPEYDLHQMACLISARHRSLLHEGFFQDAVELGRHLEKLEGLHSEPSRKDLRWQLAIGEDVLSADLRQLEFRNWIHTMVPREARA